MSQKIQNKPRFFFFFHGSFLCERDHIYKHGIYERTLPENRVEREFGGDKGRRRAHRRSGGEEAFFDKSQKVSKIGHRGLQGDGGVLRKVTEFQR